MRTLSIFLVVLCGISCAHGLFDWLLGGGSSSAAAPEGKECNWKQKDRGLIGGAVDTVGGAIGGLIGGAWGALMPTGVNKGAIEAAGGGNTGKSGGLLDGVGGLAGGGVGGIWGAVVPNSVRCGSIQGAKTTGNVGTTNRKDPACESYHWVDENGNECTPTKQEQSKDGHTDNDIDTIVHTVTLNFDDKAEGERVVNALLARWKKILAKYGVASKDVAIIVYDDQASDSTHTVTYTIKFKKPRNKKYTLDGISREFQNNLESDPLDNVSVAAE